MKLLKLLFGFLLLASCASESTSAQVPTIEIPTNGNFAPSPDVILQSLDVNVKVTGNISTTKMTMVFKNNSSKLLEGRLTFPLPEGVTVSGYALDINGKLRNAVAVEKNRAKEIFESIEKRNVDPGLLEKVEGNNFRTRIYPLPINGQRTVQITYSQELTTSTDGLQYYLPLGYNKMIPEFHLKALVNESANKPNLTESPDGSFTFEKKGSSWQAEINKTNFDAKSSLRINLPKAENQFEVILQSASDNNYYFLVHANLTSPLQKKQLPKSIGIIWDNSLSGQERNHEKEFDFLNDYFQTNQNVTVSLAFLNNEWNEQKQYKITDGNWNELKTKLQTTIYDGGTDLGLLKTLNTDEYLFFTDGLSTFGDLKLTITKPVYTIVSSTKVDFSLLKFISLKTGGQLFNLNESTTKEVQEKIAQNKPLQFLGIKPNAAVSEIYPSIPTVVNGQISIAGILSQSQTEITLLFGYDGIATKEEKIILDSSKHVTEDWDVDQMWAQKKIGELDVFYDKNREEIGNIGKQFGIVTRNTSLLVLENVNDYVRYGIAPPDELMAEYSRITKANLMQREQRIADLVSKAETMTTELKKWWKTDFNPTPIKVYPKGKQYPRTVRNRSVANETIKSDEDAEMVFSSSRAAPQANVIREEKDDLAKEKSSDKKMELNEVVVGANGIMRASFDDVTSKPNSQINQLGYSSSEPKAKITIENFKSDKDYIKKIELCKTTECAYEKYLELRKDYLHTPLFYYDVATWFFAKKETKIAMKILSAITDLDIENEELYKLISYKLKQENQKEKLLFVTKKVLDWRPMDAQSYRDYGLALEDNGQYQLALDNLYKVLTQTYSLEVGNRDQGIEETIIMEINQLISNHPEVNTKHISKKIITELPVSIRVVLNWNKDNTDIDLWVIDPRNEQCFYSHPKTELGGRLSNDFTAGFGPEQFLLKKAVKGKYKIKTNYFGDSQVFSVAGGTSLMAEVYLYYATGKQERKIVVLESESKSKNDTNGILVGQFEF